MSAQFGRWHFDGVPASPDFLGRVRTLLAPYGPDAEGRYTGKGIDLVWHAFQTTREAVQEVQPQISQSGVVVIYDGRLDNQEDLCSELDLPLDRSAVSVVGAAYDRWGTDCFQRLIGDWALSIWNPREQRLLLAKDFLGSRHLYYSIEGEQVTWSTVLDPLVLLRDRSLSLNEEYFAGWLSSFPAAHLTPYSEIHAVPPASFVTVERGKHAARKYWEFDGRKRIVYRADAEYEAHFRSAFAEAVRRRLRSDSPVLAELSGGMDSASIVCMADRIATQECAAPPRVDTVSYFSNNEPHWDELPYLCKVEEQRGHVGFHINVDSGMSPLCGDDQTAVVAPGTGRTASTLLADLIRTERYRVVLSGIGGDEVAGGVPTPLPELEDLIVTFKLKILIRKLGAWALTQRKPWPLLLIDAAGAFCAPTLASLPPHRRPGAWLRPEFVRRNRSAFLTYESRRELFGPLPSFQENLLALDAIRRQLASIGLQANPLIEKRYPFLDRTLLEFIFAIPREQLVRPGQRRSLMRRALAGIVPEEVLNRPSKGYAGRSLNTAISSQYPQLIEMCTEMVGGKLGFVTPEDFRSAIERVRLGQEAPSVSFIRTLGIECWLRGLTAHGVLNGCSADFSRLPRLEFERTPSTESNLKMRLGEFS